MPHILGHVDDTFGSCGILHVEFGNKVRELFYVPPDFIPEEGDSVGFHILEVPINQKGETLLIAYDLELLSKNKVDQTNPPPSSDPQDSDTRFRGTHEYDKYYRGNDSPYAALERLVAEMDKKAEDGDKTVEFNYGQKGTLKQWRDNAHKK